MRAACNKVNLENFKPKTLMRAVRAACRRKTLKPSNPKRARCVRFVHLPLFSGGAMSAVAVAVAVAVAAVVVVVVVAVVVVIANVVLSMV